MLNPGDGLRDYILEAKLGEGGMGEVWLARHAALGKRVAIKAMAAGLASDPKFRGRFLGEARAMAVLHHPHIVGATDFFEACGRLLLVMPFVEGRSLADRMEERGGPLPVDEALSISRDILDALDYAHRNGVIHRDVKPSNILLDGEGRAHLTDFGIALMVGEARKTRTGTTLGTPHYMSPEQIERPMSVDHRTDVYSFGCVLFEMLAGHPPFTGGPEDEGSDFKIRQGHVSARPSALVPLNPSVPSWLEGAVLRALEKDPARRFSGCGEFSALLETAAANPPPLRTLPSRQRGTLLEEGRTGKTGEGAVPRASAASGWPSGGAPGSRCPDANRGRWAGRFALVLLAIATIAGTAWLLSPRRGPAPEGPSAPAETAPQPPAPTPVRGGPGPTPSTGGNTDAPAIAGMEFVEKNPVNERLMGQYQYAYRDLKTRKLVYISYEFEPDNPDGWEVGLSTATAVNRTKPGTFDDFEVSAMSIGKPIYGLSYTREEPYWTRISTFRSKGRRWLTVTGGIADYSRVVYEMVGGEAEFYWDGEPYHDPICQEGFDPPARTKTLAADLQNDPDLVKRLVCSSTFK